MLLERLTPMTWWPFSHGPSIRFNVFYIPFGLVSKDVQTPLGVRINCEDKLGMGADTLKARNHLSPGAAPKSGPPCGFMVRYTCQGNLKSFSHALFGYRNWNPSFHSTVETADLNHVPITLNLLRVWSLIKMNCFVQFRVIHAINQLTYSIPMYSRHPRKSCVGLKCVVYISSPSMTGVALDMTRSIASATCD